MILSDRDLKFEIDTGRLKIEGVPDVYLGPSSVDMHLDNKAKVIEPDEEDVEEFARIYIQDQTSSALAFSTHDDWDSITIYPGCFYILSTVEKVTLPDNIAGFVQGRSSLARLGLNIHAAGFVDPGFSGNITLEVTNFTPIPIVIPKNTRICQVVFMYTKNPCEVPYNLKNDSKYNGQTGPTLTAIHKDYSEHGKD